MTPAKPKCTSRPDCPCDFCTGLRVKAFCYRRDREMDAERAEENQLAEDFLRSYSQTKAARGKLVKMTSNNSFIRLRREGKFF